MTTELTAIGGAIIGSSITLVSVFLNNSFQLKRDKLKYDKDLNIEKLKIENEIKLKHQTDLLNNIANTIQVLSEIQLTISLTKSVIDSSHNLKFQDFDLKYIEKSNKLSSLEGIALIYFPQMLDKIENIIGYYNNYWGYQRLLLMHYEQNSTENISPLVDKIIEYSNKTSKEIAIIKNNLFEIANQITKKIEV